MLEVKLRASSHGRQALCQGCHTLTPPVSYCPSFSSSSSSLFLLSSLLFHLFLLLLSPSSCVLHYTSLNSSNLILFTTKTLISGAAKTTITWCTSREGWFSWYSLTTEVSRCCQGSGLWPQLPILTVPNQVSLINLTCFLRNSFLRHTGFGCVEGTEINTGNLQSLGHKEVKIRGTCTSWERARALNTQGWEDLEDAGIQAGES